jgi:hypothetical protein
MKKILGLCLLILLILSGCKKDKSDPPLLPPEGSLLIDFSNFAYNSKSAITKDLKNIPSNWEVAVKTTDFWKDVYGLLNMHLIAFQMVIDRSPANISDKIWQWEHTSSVGQNNIKARLTGQISGSQVKWEMYITSNGGSEFKWFEGTSESDGKSGSWRLYESPSSPVAFIDIIWTRPGQSTGTIKYTYVKNDAYLDSFIEYKLTNDSPYNAGFVIHYWNGVKFSDVIIEWNSTTYNGRIKSIDNFPDDGWYCWNSNKVDGNCL